jgi:DNA-binding NarL/FixJ family response regulator
LLNCAKRIRVVVVDYHELVRLTLCVRLVRAPDVVVVGSAGTPDEAVQRAVEHQPNVVLMDIDLNGQTSLDATQRIRESCPTSRLVFVSAFTHDRYIEFAIRIGASGFVSKSEKLDSLVAAVRTVAMGGRYFSADVSQRLLRQPCMSGPAATPRSRYSTLTPRQREILVQIAQGRSKRDIATQLGITVKTVETHCETMMSRLQVNDRVGLTRYAIREGLVRP